MKSFRQRPRPKKSTLVIGRSAVQQALASGTPLDRIYLDRSMKGRFREELRILAQQNRVPINEVPAAKLEAFNAGDHEGVIALKAKVSYVLLPDLISLIFDKGEAPLLLILDGVTDIRNIGAIARTAFCLGADGIIIPDKGVGALNEDAILTSAGALERIPVCRVSSLLKTVDELHEHGIRVYGAEMKAATDITGIDWSLPSAIIMGNEEKGIYPALLKACDEKIRISMKGDFESLNVSVAAAIILYEAMRNRRHG